MAGTWTFICPRGGVYAGEGHYIKKGEGLAVHLKKVVKHRDPRGGTCDGTIKGFSCKKQERTACLATAKAKCKGDCDPEAVCRALVPCGQ